MNEQGKPRGILGLWKDRNGQTMSTSISDKTLDELEEFVCRMRAIPAESRGRLAVWSNKSDNDKAPAYRLLHLPPRDKRASEDY